jgi:hypothetical protein
MASMTGNGLIKTAMKELGALAIGQTPSASEQDEGLSVLNAMVDTWNTERLTVHQIAIADYALQNDVQAYTIGSGGDFSATRPTKIEDAAILVGDAGGTPSQDKVRIAIDIVDSRQWVRIRQQRAKSTFPEAVYPDYASPLCKLRFWPIPNFTGTPPRVELQTWNVIAAFDATTTVTLPEGFVRAIELNLAIQLASQYGRPLTEDLRRNAIEAKAALQAFNAALPSGDPPTPIGAQLQQPQTTPAGGAAVGQ